MDSKEPTRTKWQRPALRPTSANSSLPSEQQQQATAKPKARPKSTPNRAATEKENVSTPRYNTRTSTGRPGSATPLTAAALQQQRTGVLTRSAAKQPSAPANRQGSTQNAPVARAFGRALTATQPRVPTSSRGNTPRGTTATAGRSARCASSILAAPGVAAHPAQAPTAVTEAAASPAAGAGASETTEQRQHQRRLSRRVSGNHDRNLGMDKLQSEYEALQQKLALLKRDSSRDGKLQQSTPMASIPGPRLAAAAATAGEAPPSGFPAAEPASAAPDSTIAGAAMTRPGSCSGDTGPLSFGSMSVLQSCENLQLQCSIPDAGGVLQSLKFLAKHPGSRMAQLAESSLGDTEFVQLCEQGLTAQLQRTRDGATAQSRIAELAGALVIAGFGHGCTTLDVACAQMSSSWRCTTSAQRV
jgi:hypothetical protein